jgi:hypothetical protein
MIALFGENPSTGEEFTNAADRPVLVRGLRKGALLGQLA